MRNLRAILLSGLVALAVLPGCQQNDPVVSPPTTVAKPDGTAKTNNGAPQGQQTNNQTAPTLDVGEQFTAAQSAAASVDFDAQLLKTNVITKSDKGEVDQLESLESLTKFWLSDSGTQTYEIDKHTNLIVKFDIKNTSHPGEMQLIDELKPEQKLIFTVESITGQTFAKYDLGSNGTFKDKPVGDISLDMGVPASDELVPAFIFICVDGDDDGSCGDERVKNLNLYFTLFFTSPEENHLGAVVQGDVQSASEADDFMSGDAFFFNSGYKYLGEDHKPGLMIYSKAVDIDPVLKKIIVRPDDSIQGEGDAKYMALEDSAGAKDRDTQKEGLVSKIFFLVEDMTDSFPAVDAGTEVSISNGPVLRIPLASYCADCEEVYGGSEVGGSGNSGGELTGGDDELLEGGETGGGSNYRKPAVVYRDGNINCQEVCECTPSGQKSCTHPQGQQNDAVFQNSCLGNAAGCGCEWNDATGSFGFRCASQSTRANGCFVEGTKIAITNGREIPVETIRDGVKVLDKNKVARVATGAVAGPEAAKIIVFSTESGSKLGVSELHAMVTVTGLKVAKDVTMADSLLTATGAYTRIAKIERQTYPAGKFVYNFTLNSTSNKDADHMMVAEGIVTGDLFLQQKLSPAPRTIAKAK